MNHDDDVSSRGQRETVTSLLICPVATIYRMDLHLDAIKSARDGHSFILAGVVHHNHKIDNAVRHYFIVSLTQSTRRIIGGHHHDNFLAV